MKSISEDAVLHLIHARDELVAENEKLQACCATARLLAKSLIEHEHKQLNISVGTRKEKS